jgi:hypothetical protein
MVRVQILLNLADKKGVLKLNQSVKEKMRATSEAEVEPFQVRTNDHFIHR